MYFLRFALVCTVSVVAALPTISQQPVRPPLSKPLTPKQAQAAFKLAPGLRIELAASEPQIESPVAMAFDENGRLWVVEMRDYPNGPAPGADPEGRIKILDDKDGDGFYETAAVFADKLLFANGLLLWKDGVIVTAAPHILWLRDTDGDGKADRREVLYEGFTAQNPQLRVSHPVLGIDNWVYVANGLRGGKVRRTGKSAPAIDISGRDFRFHLLRKLAEAETGQGQYGNTFDDWGRRYVCTNRNHLIPIVIPQRYLARNPFLIPPDPARDNQTPGGAARVFPLSKNWTTATFHAGTFSAACGVTVYRGTLLPESFRNCAFTCEPTGNLVHQEVIEADGAGVKHRAAYADREFLATPDDWCRPVSLAHGPDGALYVVDMYRAVIEHPDFMPVELKKRPDLLLGKDMGRIWRIVPEGATRRLRLSASSTPELVRQLAEPDAWQRTTAQRLLLARQDKSAVPLLRELAMKSDPPLGRAHAAWMLDGMDSLDVEIVLRLLNDADSRVREQALRLGERWLATDRRVQERILALASDADARVRFQAALGLGGWDDDRILSALVQAALLGADDAWTRTAVATAVAKRAGPLLVSMVTKAKEAPGVLPLIHEVAGLVGARRDAAEVAMTLYWLTKRLGGKGSQLQTMAVAGIAEGMRRRGTRLGDFVEKLPAEHASVANDMARLFDRAAVEAANAKLAADQRLAAIQLLAHAPWTTARPALEPLAGSNALPDLQPAAISALAAQPHRDVAAILLRPWAEYAPSARRQVIDALMRNPARIPALLDAVAEGRVRPAEFDALRTRQLMNHANLDIRKRARDLLKQNVPADRKVVLEKYQAALKQPGDIVKGRDLFRKHCATCHRLENVGHAVGPDISDLQRTKTAEMLLLDVLNPNAAIDGNFVNYTVTTKSGKTYSGILAAETAGSLTLRRGDNQSDVILRQDIDEIVNSGMSLMPDGFEKSIAISEMADLLAYLKSWRYHDDTKGK